MHLTYFFSGVTLFALSVSAQQSISESVNSIIPNVCKSQCNNWVSSVGDCIGNANVTYSASINTGDLSSWKFDGDLSVLSSCLCSAEAVQASESCLSCASTNLCISPPLTMQDYSLVCQNPRYGMDIFNRYHPDIGSCSPSETMTETESPTETMTETESPTETMTETESPTETMTETESPTETMTETESPTETMTETESETETMTETETETSSETMTETETETSSETMTETETETETPTETPTMTETETMSEDCTVTVTATPLSIPRYRPYNGKRKRMN